MYYSSPQQENIMWLISITFPVSQNMVHMDQSFYWLYHPYPGFKEVDNFPDVFIATLKQKLDEPLAQPNHDSQ